MDVTCWLGLVLLYLDKDAKELYNVTFLVSCWMSLLSSFVISVVVWKRTVETKTITICLCILSTHAFSNSLWRKLFERWLCAVHLTCLCAVLVDFLYVSGIFPFTGILLWSTDKYHQCVEITGRWGSICQVTPLTCYFRRPLQEGADCLVLYLAPHSLFTYMLCSGAWNNGLDVPLAHRYEWLAGESVRLSQARQVLSRSTLVC